MRIHIAHTTAYRYDPPVNGVIQTLRLTPRNHEGQYVMRWRIEVSANCRLEQHEDAFGNIIHNFTAEGRLDALNVQVEGEVETQDTAGIIRGAIERFPPSLFLRDTPLAHADPAIAAFAEQQEAASGDDRLTLLHRLLAGLSQDITFDTDPTHAHTMAAEAFTLKRGVCQDFAHVFIAACRNRGVPARYVSGYLRRADGIVAQDAGHAWAEAFIPDLGWIAFDAANGVCATDAYVRTAVGLDYLSAAPVRGTRYGGGSETLTVAVHVDQAGRQVQS
ncbi:MAG: transglutaminase family protein [Rhizobiales bacterium]|nr:transglutaminase family protein [Hyphomicrobiales bacterium]